MKKKAYRDCDKALIKNIFEVSKDELFSRGEANRLNPSGDNPIVKMRIAYKKGKSSSYRLYFFAVRRKENLYLGHLYPKTGNKGKAALSKNEEKFVIKDLLNDARDENVSEVYHNK